MRHVIIPIVVLAILLSAGIFECICIHNTFAKFEKEVDQLIYLCEQENLTVERYADFVDYWHKIRVKSEFFLPHNDVYEITLRISETTAYVAEQDYELCLGHLAVMKELSNYVSRIAIPSLGHIF